MKMQKSYLNIQKKIIYRHIFKLVTHVTILTFPRVDTTALV